MSPQLAGGNVLREITRGTSRSDGAGGGGLLSRLLTGSSVLPLRHERSSAAMSLIPLCNASIMETKRLCMRVDILFIESLGYGGGGQVELRQ